MSLPTQTTKYPFEQKMSHSDRVNLARAFLADDIPATNNISNDEPCVSSLAQSDYVVPVAPMPRFPFSAAMTNHFHKIHQDLQPTTVGRSQRFATVSLTKEAIYNPFELPSRDFSFSKDPPVIDRGFSDVTCSHAGGAHSKKLGAEQRYFCDLASMSRRRLCIFSIQDWSGAALNHSIQGLIDHLSMENVPAESA